MAARYVDTANIVAQGQSFYTGLLPGSYEKGGAGGGSNVMGKGSGGSAGVSADRTGSEAAGQSIKDYKGGGSFLGKQQPTDSDLLGQIAKNTAGGQGGQAVAFPSPGPRGPRGAPGAPGTPGYTGGTQGQPPPRQTPSSRGVTIDADSKEIGPGSATPKALGPPSPLAADKIMPQTERLKWAAAGLPNPPNRSGQNPFGHDKGQGMGSLIPGAPSGGVGQGTRTPQGLGTGQRPQHGSVQGRASTRSHTRQSGVQASATQQSIPFPNMANSTNRSLNF
jgi:hypothetical protein